MFLAGLTASLGGMLCLALSQQKTARALLRRMPAVAPRPWLRLAGFTLLLISCALGVVAYGVGVGLTTFFGWACAASWSIALAAAWRRKA